METKPRVFSDRFRIVSEKRGEGIRKALANDIHSSELGVRRFFLSRMRSKARVESDPKGRSMSCG